MDVNAGGEVFLEEGAGDFAGFGERGAGDEDEAELGGGWHGREEIVADSDLGGEERGKITQRCRTQRGAEKRNPRAQAGGACATLVEIWIGKTPTRNIGVWGTREEKPGRAGPLHGTRGSG